MVVIFTDDSNVKGLDPVLTYVFIIIKQMHMTLSARL